MIPVPSDTAIHARLRWLITLRWLALAGVSIAACFAVAGVVPGINLSVVGIAVLLGLGANAFLLTRLRSGPEPEAAVWQALLDTGALTLVLWASGGADCPFLGFYIFPMLLAGLLAGRAALWPTGLATVAGLLFQYAAAHTSLRVGHWDPPAAWADLLHLIAITSTVGMAAYFALRFTEALRQQITARREADTMLALAFDGLHAGLEVVESGRVLWQNPEAEKLVGSRVGTQWVCPARLDGQCALSGTEICQPTGSNRAPSCGFNRTPDGREQLFEMLAFPLPHGDRFMTMYVDRTEEILARRKLVLTDRLASLGRTVQGVAHELNTPLATIQTLGRDLLDVLPLANLPPNLHTDLDESATMIVAEVQRCRRITHALLGRAEHLDARTGDAPLAAAVDRAIAVVFTHGQRCAVEQCDTVSQVKYPLDPVVQICVNLLQNARDAAPDGQVSLLITASSDTANVLIQVRDTGLGITPATAQHLFEPFFTTKPPGRGTGLGLYTSYALAKSLGGELSLVNHPDGGVMATLALPNPN